MGGRRPMIAIADPPPWRGVGASAGATGEKLLRKVEGTSMEV